MSCSPNAASPSITSPYTRWVQRFTPEFIEAARICRHAPGDRWFADETYVKVAGRWAFLYRAIDQHGQVIDVMLTARRDHLRRGHYELAADIPARHRIPAAFDVLVTTI